MIWLVFEKLSMFFAYFCLIKISKRIVVKKRETLGLNKCFFCFCFVFFEKKKKKIHVRWAHEYITHRGSWCWHIQKTFDEIRNNHILKFEKNKTQKSSFLKKHQGRFCSHPSWRSYFIPRSFHRKTNTTTSSSDKI